MSKLSNLANNEVVKTTMYDKLVEKVNNIDTSGFVLKTKCNMDKSDLEKKYLILVDLLKKDYNAKITEIEGKITCITGLVTTTALTAV